MRQRLAGVFGDRGGARDGRGGRRQALPRPQSPPRVQQAVRLPRTRRRDASPGQGAPRLALDVEHRQERRGRDLWCITVNNPKTGPDRDKPAMYVDGNIHGNEIQGAEAALYLVWYLAENRGRVKAVKELTDERAFYVVPTVNPDGRAYWFNGPNTTNSSRSGKSPARRRPRRRRRRGRVRRPQRRRPDHRDAPKNPHGRYKVSPKTRDCSSRSSRAKTASTTCSATRGSTTTATAWSTRTRRAVMT